MDSLGHLTLESEAGAELVAGLVQLLGIERAANTESQTRVDLGVVGEGRNAEVVDLGLSIGLVSSLQMISRVQCVPWQRKQGRACTWQRAQDRH